MDFAGFILHLMRQQFLQCRIANFQMMKVIISDQGPHFKSMMVNRLTQMLKINHHMVVAYSPWSNGSIERLNREVKRAFKTLLLEDGMFEIEDIIGYKLVEGQEWVRIKWKGFEVEQSSWEPADYIEGIAPALVQKARMLGKGGVLGQIRPNTNYGPNLPQGTGIRNISSPSL